MKHTEILTSAAGNLKSREDQFGPEERAFDNAAQIASIMLGKPITQHDITTILLCVDLGRIPQSRTNNINYVNLINNAAYVGQYSRSEATVMSSLSDEITNMASRLAPTMPRVEPVNISE